MVAHAPPPILVTQDGVFRQGELTPQTTRLHVDAIKAALFAHEATIEALPDGALKTRLQREVLVLHNRLNRGAQALDAHAGARFQLADDSTPSPYSEGGDKGDSSQDTVSG